MDKKILSIIGIVIMMVVVGCALFLTGIIHTGSFAYPGTTYGPGTYTIGTDLPAGEYDLQDPFDLEGSATFSASSNGGLSISNEGVQLDSGAVVTIQEGGSMTYIGN